MDYGDLRSRLDMYMSGSNACKKHVGKENSIESVLEGTVCSNEDGCFYLVENRYPLTYIHGGVALGESLDICTSSLGRICTGIGCDTGIGDFLFLDTETTGLSGGTGTLAFLIGAGRFERDSFVIRQYFMRDYDEEPAALRALNELLAAHKGLVTFNGKAFDWNILQSRFIYNRIALGLPEPIHVDLLFPSRMIWKAVLESCRLVSLEENILGEFRYDDIPGALIPSVYFKYLDDRDAADIKKVIRHNEIDILSMVSLLIKIAAMLKEPLGKSERVHELFGLGRIFEKNGEYDKVIDCFEECIKSAGPAVREAALRRLSDIYKKNRDYSRAAEHWEKMLEDPQRHSVFPLVELAKYYEHRKKDIPKAIDAVRKAMECSARLGLGNSCHSSLKKRLNRLLRKAGREEYVRYIQRAD
jgi:uncharacterized protein YprB with RNaseH-like and TPR domain